ncbi:hypothetical protein [Cupriavidus necator]|jgi:hypothetical protein|uniref:hypothetical protein n=1 Tax=Cupriavidus necator TaxID=106590 RepID=UPI0011D23D66|nr:hypothetical protein [Cupriavidus necator]MDX6008062.1 hypothetical protein [Cupriavidus necator]
MPFGRRISTAPLAREGISAFNLACGRLKIPLFLDYRLNDTLLLTLNALGMHAWARKRMPWLGQAAAQAANVAGVRKGAPRSGRLSISVASHD